MRVIDSSSLVKLFSKEEGWKTVRELIIQGVVSLDLSVKEVANALWKKALRDEMSTRDAGKIISDLLEADVVKLVSQGRSLLEAFKIAVRHKVTVYDALFIALAKELDAELVTSDRRQAEVAEKEGVATRLL